MTDVSDAKQQRKAEKKAKKAARKAAEAAAEQTQNPAEEQPKKHKKDKKRDREEAEVESSEKPKKQHKKEKKNKKKNDGEAPSTDFSSGPYQQPASADGSFKKAFYTEGKDTAKMTDKEVGAFHEANQMILSGNNCLYRPVLSFDDVTFESKFMKTTKGFDKPTPIQSQCWPILASGRDIIGIAETGSGKTLAFSIPGLIHIAEQPAVSPNHPGPRMLVVAPTRELAMQSSAVISEAGKKCGLKSVCIYGGVPKHTQKKALRDGVHVVVATPGRLKDLVEERSCNLSKVTFVVLDEADRMLDEGFEKDIRAIIGSTHPERQIAMFSATWPQSIQKLAHEFLNDPVKVTIGSDELAASHNVTQIVEVVEDRARDARAHGLLQKYHSSRKNRVLLFVLYKKEADRVERMLHQRGWNCIAIHGDRTQQQRSEAIEQFKSGEVPLLIATDVAARGLDIPDVEYVLNYSFPLTIEDYVHRIGRTGRGGKKGIAHTFFTANDKPRAGELVNLLRESNQEVPNDLTKFGTHVKKKEHKLYGAFAKNIDVNKKATKITFDSDDE
ncbi:DEAD-box ATP-dependent RNA helicase 5 [Phytophthora fragariae]|uniref:RNA helicase n=3 Tax=Phytophthora fragariae TaxID=53985 RepID=A0A6A4EIW5_9STRA|nr:DEAD-box ATP-dependent RNA helicase 5 [Phytophthora fragariae]KAE8945264.1 DEAD-box ATP-dependent RNA helicase 5 [Phytophthora fragariae]KAE9129744.1 DEAD-box ATP-dependent RNA helicase 5 [Phytophthora fragariae]KAE9129951.1 DEAD-box ATP-dependent RNA helicase 5 [Phytophthora fragariae]KAE9152094.1 DEAD-box ATP-dependent RNA helicase 5 [Phytophthora fragariae]